VRSKPERRGAAAKREILAPFVPFRGNHIRVHPPCSRPSRQVGVHPWFRFLRLLWFFVATAFLEKEVATRWQRLKDVSA
jgi:hypothetical protein